MRQLAFENDGQTRPNLLASKFTALTVVSAFAIAGCANGEQGNDPAPGVEQISNEAIDISSLTDKQKDRFDQLTTEHRGTIEGLHDKVIENQYILGADGEAFSALTIEVGGRDINCGIARNVERFAYEPPADFESEAFDPNTYQYICQGYGSTPELGLFIPYMGRIQEVAEEVTPAGTPPELTVGLIYQAGEELMSVYNNPQDIHTRDSVIDELSSAADSWGALGHIPTKEETGTILDAAMDVYGLSPEALTEGNVAAPEAPAPAETTQPAIEPEFETNVSEALGISVSDLANYPLTTVQTDFEKAKSSDAEAQAYYDAESGNFVPCAEYFDVAKCSDTQTRAMYIAEETQLSFYDITGAASETSPATQRATIYNLLLQANDPDLRANGGLQTYTFNSLIADVQSQLHSGPSKAEIKDIARNTLETLGVSLSEN